MQSNWERRLTNQLQEDSKKFTIVIDANIVIAALIKKSKTSKLIFNKKLILITPDFLFLELLKHKNLIMKKTKRDEESLKEIILDLNELIITVPEEEIISFYKKAQRICPDPDDIHYFALALKLNNPIWSNDKKLKEQEEVEVYNTEEIIRVIEKKI